MSNNQNQGASVEAELLSCPFCGGRAEYVSEHDDRGNAAIECSECGASVGANMPPVGERWNRRTQPAGAGVPSDTLEYRTCCDHPDCTTCAGRGGHYRLARQGAAPAQAEPVTPPATPEEVVAFIGNRYASLEDKGDVDDIMFLLSVHDLRYAFYDWFEEALAAPTQPAAPASAQPGELLSEILDLATQGMCHGLMADDFCNQIVAKIEGKSASAQPDRGAAQGMIPITASLPSPDEHDRVLVYTEGFDFAGEQYFDIKAEELWEVDAEARTEVSVAASHWMPLPRPDAAPHSQPVRGVLDGWKLVPVEPTQAMCDAGRARAAEWENSGEPWGAMTWFRIYKSMLAAAPSPAVQPVAPLAPVSQQGAQVGERWSKQPPTEQADYWHWDGDEDHAPMIYHIMWSGSANKCFVSIGQYDIREAIWCDKFGGWWMKIDQPGIPPQSTATEGADGMGGE